MSLGKFNTVFRGQNPDTPRYEQDLVSFPSHPIRATSLVLPWLTTVIPSPLYFVTAILHAGAKCDVDAWRRWESE